MDKEEKTCVRCGRRIEWRKKWERSWEEVKYCSQACQKRKLSRKDKEMEALILQLLEQRGAGKSICPSEPVRILFSEEEWQGHMEEGRMAARRLVAKGLVEMTQKGVVRDPSTVKGPVRIRLRK